MNVTACNQMLVLCGPTYPTRLWCVWELFTILSFSSLQNAWERITLAALIPEHQNPLVGEKPDGEEETKHTSGDPANAATKSFGESTERDVRKLSNTNDGLDTLLKFDVANARCYNPNEEARLLEIINGAGEGVFNTRIRELAAVCRKAQKSKRKLAGRRPSRRWKEKKEKQSSTAPTSPLAEKHTVGSIASVLKISSTVRGLPKKGSQSAIAPV